MKTKIFATTDPVKESELEDYFSLLSKQKVKNIHFDVMDGKFVSAKKITSKIITVLSQKFSSLSFNVHLMTQNPCDFLKKIKNARICTVYAHIEAFETSEDVVKFLRLAKEFSFKPGIAIKPESKVSELGKEVISTCKNFLIMGVIPGKSGQKMIKSTINKITSLKKLSPKCNVAFDGGVNEKNISKIIKKGANEIALGSLMFKLASENKVASFLAQF